jgi:hypothetical protein
MKKEPIEGRAGLSGLRVVVVGRPNASSRSQQISFQFGKITTASFYNSHVSQESAAAKAQIGAFSITVTTTA